jgi:hypothetical protein
MFQTVEITWRDEHYVIPPDKVLPAIAVLEQYVTMGDLARDAKTGSFRLALIAGAWGALLRHLGSKATDDEVYVELFHGKQEEVKAKIFVAVNTLLVLMVPPQAEAAALGGGKRKAAATVGRLKRSTKR